jgi:hypothetical protein
MPSTWEGTPEELKYDEYNYPVLRLELGGQWTDFELKATTNDFTNLVYYYMSWLTNATDVTGDAEYPTADDDDPYSFYLDDHATNGGARPIVRWRNAAPHGDLGAGLASVSSEVEVVYFYPSHSCEFPWARWMWRTNTRLKWSYVRCDGATKELNLSGTQEEHWNPVRF